MAEQSNFYTATTIVKSYDYNGGVMVNDPRNGIIAGCTQTAGGSRSRWLPGDVFVAYNENGVAAVYGILTATNEDKDIDGNPVTKFTYKTSGMDVIFYTESAVSVGSIVAVPLVGQGARTLVNWYNLQVVPNAGAANMLVIGHVTKVSPVEDQYKERFGNPTTGSQIVVNIAKEIYELRRTA